MNTFVDIHNIIKSYFVSVGYSDSEVEKLFSSCTFERIAVLKLVNSNIVNKNKRDKSSHQSHIAITGDAIGMFYSKEMFKKLETNLVEFKNVCTSLANLRFLEGEKSPVSEHIKMIDGKVTVGRRTQSQLQFSKKMSFDSECVSRLRNCLFEDDLLIMLKYRYFDKVLLIGIPKLYYNVHFPDFFMDNGTTLYKEL